MRLATSFLRLAMCLSTAAPLVSAWPDFLPKRDSLVVRADAGEGNTATPTTASSAAANTAATTSDSGSQTSNDSPPNTTSGNQNSASATSGGSSKSSSKGSSNSASNSASNGSASGGNGTTSTSSQTFPADSPAGGVVMQTPATTAIGTALYKIGDFVTLGWTYTNLLGPPSAIDVLASCSTAAETWTLTSNMTFQTSGSFTWDTSVQETAVESPLLVAMYTLIIKDTDASISQAPQAGFLGTYSQFTFGLYTPQPYTPFPEWRCDACNAALSNFDHQALGFAITMGLVTVLSFTWFVSGLGLH